MSDPSRILIVEDEQITAADLADVVSGFGHDVVGTAVSASEAMALAESTKPDLILMDIVLKGREDGVTAARRILAKFGIPCLYLTAHSDPPTLVRAKDAEPLGYIVKPFHADELHAAIEMALYKAKSDRRLRESQGKLATTLDALAEAVIRFDRNGNIAYLNEAAGWWTGWSVAEAEGRPLSDVLRLETGEKRESLDLLLRPAMERLKVTELPGGVVIRSRGGERRAAAGSVAPIIDPHDPIGGAVVVLGEPGGSSSRDERRTRANRNLSIVAESEAMRNALSYARRIAASGVSSILIQGESGVGKDLLAHYIHESSSRSSQQFVAVNCAAIPESLLESELFGYEKGAFTDARSQKRGVLEMAHSGTVFLDEVSELQAPLQAKLLRFLEDQTFRRLGGLEEVQVDVRVIAATNANLTHAVRDGRFRHDLYYRLNVIQIALPPLRERMEDVLPLAERFIEHFNERFRRNINGLHPEAADRLSRHSWPGNVRELRNALERAVALADGPEIEAEALDLTQGAAPSVATAVDDGPTTLPDAERNMILRALKDAGGNQTHAAARLGISRDTLRYRIKKHRISTDLGLNS